MNGRNHVEVNVDGNARGLDNTLTRAGRSLDTFGSRAGRVAHSMDRMAKSMTGTFTMLAGGVGAGLAARGMIQLEERMIRLANQSGMSRTEMAGLHDELWDIARTKFSSPEELLSGIDAIVERTGDVAFAKAVINDLAVVSGATGASMTALGATAANLWEKMGIGAPDMMEMFDVLSAQGKMGSFTLGNMATEFESLLSAASRFNITGVEGMREFGAVLQLVKRGFGSAAEATTGMENIVEELISKAGDIEKNFGVSVFDPEESAKQGRAVARSFDDVLKDIIRSTNADTEKLSRVFGEVSLAALEGLRASFAKTGDFRELEKFLGVGGDGSAVMQDFSFWTESTAAQLQRLKTTLAGLANEHLANPIEWFTDAVEFASEHPKAMDALIKGVIGVGGAALTWRAGRGAWNMGKGGFDLARRGYRWMDGRPGGGPGGLGGLGGFPGKPVPVFVTNMKGVPGMGGKGGVPDIVNPQGPFKRRGGRIGRIARGLSPLALPLIGWGLWEAGQHIQKDAGQRLLEADPEGGTPYTGDDPVINDLLRPGGSAAPKVNNEINLSITFDPDKNPRVMDVDDRNTRVSMTPEKHIK